MAKIYRVPAKIDNIHDGDTLGLVLDLGFFIQLSGHTCRILGINAPELSTSEGKISKTFVDNWSIKHSKNSKLEWPFSFESHGLDKYGRWLGVLSSVDDGHSLGQDLLEANMAVVYKLKDIL